MDIYFLKPTNNWGGERKWSVQKETHKGREVWKFLPSCTDFPQITFEYNLPKEVVTKARIGKPSTEPVKTQKVAEYAMMSGRSLNENRCCFVVQHRAQALHVEGTQYY
ncbi:UNVERIFIED_CONTAM: hypothetical protein K2H54_046315 [Gekko kuhli]